MDEQGTYNAEHIERLLQCAICLDRYRQPKLLPCQHTFCESPCLEGLVRGLTRTLKCPECRAEHFVPYQGVSGFPNNLTIKSFLDLPVLRQVSESGGEARNVTGAPAESARAVPPDYPNFGPAVNFPDTPVAAAARSGCASCSRELNLIRCPHCDQILCHGCKTSHMEQVQTDVSRLIGQIRRCTPRLSDAISLMERKSEQIRQRAESAKSDITETIERYIMELRGRQRLLHSEVEMFLLGEIRSLRMHQETLESEMAEIASFCDSTDASLSRANRVVPDEDLVEIRRRCVEHFENIRSYEDGTNTVPRERSLEFLMEESRLSHAISNFGEVLINHTSQDSPPPSEESEDDLPAALPVVPTETTTSASLSSDTSTESGPPPYALVSSIPRTIPQSSYLPSTSTPYSRHLSTSANTEGAETYGITNIRPTSSGAYTYMPSSTSPTARSSYSTSSYSPVSSPTSSGLLSARSYTPSSSSYLFPTSHTGTYYPEVSPLSRITSSPVMPYSNGSTRDHNWSSGYDSHARLSPRRSLQEARRRNYTDSIAGTRRPPGLTSAYHHPLSATERRIRSLSTGASLFRINETRGYIAATRGQRGYTDEDASASGGTRGWMHTLDEGNESMESSSSRESSADLSWREPMRFEVRLANTTEEPEEYVVLAVDDNFPDFDGNESTIVAESMYRYENKGTATSVFGQRGNDRLDLMWPRGVATSSRENHVFIADSSNHRIQVVDMNGTYIRTFGSYGDGEGEFDSLTGVAVNSFRQIIVSDRYNHRIQVFDIQGNFQFQFGEEGTEAGQLLYPWGVACDRMGFTYVCDKENHRVQVFQSNGSFVRKFGSRGKRSGQFLNPHYLAISPDNRIYVADTSNHRIQVFSMYGDFLFSFGSLGTMQGQMREPKGITIDEQGFVVVGDSGNNRIQIFHGDGRIYCAFGCYGIGPGEFNNIEGVALLSNGTLVVCDRENHRVQYFSS